MTGGKLFIGAFSLFLLGLAGPLYGSSPRQVTTCRVAWSDFFKALNKKNIHLTPRHSTASHTAGSTDGYCELDAKSGVMSILPYAPGQHFCQLQFPGRTKKLNNDWVIRRLDIIAAGARWRLQHNQKTGGFILKLQGDNKKAYKLRITSIYLRNAGTKVSCQNNENGWHRLFWR